MGFKIRGYTRDIPQEKVRDYSLFAIAAFALLSVAYVLFKRTEPMSRSGTGM